MILNVKKCSIISFNRTNFHVENDYVMGGETLKRDFVIRDLGVIFDHKLNFKSHIDKVTSSGYSILGFVKRRAKEFNDPYVTKRMYVALVQSTLEYANVVWSPYRQIDINRIESVQKQFLLFALKPLGFTGYVLPPYVNRLLLLDMTTLENRRELTLALLGFDLMRKNIRIEALTNRLLVRQMNYSLRNARILTETNHSNDFAYNDTIDRCVRTFNKYSNLYDENISKNNFKKKIELKMKTLYNSVN